MKTILITGIGGPAGRSLAEQFSCLDGDDPRCDDTDYVVIGADIQPVDTPHVTRTVVVPRADDPAMVPALISLAATLKADLVIPTVADELAEVAVASELFAPIPVVISAPRGAGLCQDKKFTMDALDLAGIPTPGALLPTEFVSAEAAGATLGWPFVIKPRVSRGGRGVIVVDTPDDIDWTTLGPAHVLQRFAPGTEYAPQVYRSPRTAEVTVVVLEKTALKQGRVGNAESVVRLPTSAALDVVHLAAATARALDLTGPIDMDIRRMPDGSPVVLEVNARFGANSAHAPELLRATLADYLAS